MKKKEKAHVCAVVVSAMTLAFAANAAAAVKGDVNGDGSVNLADVTKVSRYLTGKDTDLTDGDAADLNGDGRINAIDLTLVKRSVLTASDVTVTPDDSYVTQITFDSGSVTLKNANDAVVSADQAQNVKVENGTYVTITQPTSDGTNDFGDINIDGTCTNGQIKVDVDETTYANGQVTVNLRGLTLSNQTDSPIYVSQIADEFVLTVKKDTVNTISDGTSYTNADQGSGAVYSLDDMKIKGKGTLIVNGNCGDGIVCKDDLKIWNGDIQVTAVDDGIRGKDSIRIGDPDATDNYTGLKVSVKTTSGDGLKTTNDTADSGKGYIRINGGTIDIDVNEGDGIQAEQAVEINGGDITISTYEGSSYTGTSSSSGGNTGWGWGGGPGGGPGGGQDGNSNKTDISAKGIKAVGLYDAAGTTWQSGGTITITGGNLNIDSSDDCIHGSGNVDLFGGQMTLATADDGCHSDRIITIGDSTADDYQDVVINVTKAYEGIEAVQICQKSGSVTVKSTDDGYNAGGGADGSGSGGFGGPGGGWGQGSSASNGLSYLLQFDGGFAIVSVDNGDHDGYDSNGDIVINGGYVITNGNEPFDCGDSGNSIRVNGGVWVSNCASGGMNMGGSSMTATATASGSVSAGQRVSVVDSAGNVVVSFITGKAVSEFKVGGNVKSGVSFQTGGTLNNATYFQTLNTTQTAAYGGTLSGGTAISGGSGGFNPFG